MHESALAVAGRKFRKTMNSSSRQSRFASFHGTVGAIAISCIVLFSSGLAVALAQTPEAQSQVMTTTKEAPKIPNDQLDSLVAPIALYPDQLLSQTLVASTYPLEIIQLEQWSEKNKNLKDKALADAVQKQNWDPSVQAMAAFPDVAKRLADDIQWTTDLGNAFLAQESDVMDAVQRMRAKAESKGTLKTSAQQKVETQTVEGKQVIVVQQASPDVVYVPSYDPAVVYGPPAYPYPPIYYPPPGYYAAGAAVAFGTGVALGAAWGGNWGWNCGWGHGDVNVNVNNKYVNNYNKNNYNKANYNKQGGNWQHNSQHRGGAPYNRASASQVQGQLASRGQGGAGAGNRPGGGGAGTANRPGGGGAGTANRPGGGGGGTAHRPGGGGGGGGDRVGGRNLSADSGFGSKGGGAFGGSSGGMNRSSATASHNRGSHSMGASRGGGGGHRGGGGGGHRGGGGRRR